MVRCSPVPEMFTMQSALALVVVAWLLCPQLVWASQGTEFVRRQCDLIACDSGEENWFTGLFGGLSKWVENSLDWGSTTTDDGMADLRIPPTPAPAQPGDEVFVQGEKSTGSKSCEANASPTPHPQAAISVSHPWSKHCSTSFKF